MKFAEYTRTYAKGAGLLVASAAVSYFLTYYSALSPPLKPREAIYGMSVLVEAYGILVGLAAARSRKPPLKLMIAAVIFYLISLFSLTFLIPTSESSYREAIGFICKKEFTAVYGPTCYWITPEVLGNASYEPDRIWEYWSIEIIRLFLAGAWLLLVWSVVISIALSIRRTDFARKRSSPRA